MRTASSVTLRVLMTCVSARVGAAAVEDRELEAALEESANDEAVRATARAAEDARYAEEDDGGAPDVSVTIETIDPAVDFGDLRPAGTIDPIYTLYAVVRHKGGDDDRGHYTTNARDESGAWLHYDDSTVTVSTVEALEAPVVQSEAYMLFFVLDEVRMSSSARCVPAAPPRVGGDAGGSAQPPAIGTHTGVLSFRVRDGAGDDDDSSD